MNFDFLDQPRNEKLQHEATALQLRLLPVFVALIAFWTAAATSLVARLHGRSIDDIFITYRFAQNLTLGNGFVFNPGERIFATTAPGHGLLLALLNFLTGSPIHVLGTITTGVALVLLATIVLFECSRHGRAIEGALGGTWIVCCSYLWLFHGSEIFVALTMLAAVALMADRLPILAGACAGLAVWFRPEEMLAITILVALLWLEKKRPPWRFALSSAVVVAAGVASAIWWFGSPIPVTLAAKQAQAISSFNAWTSGAGFWKAATAHFGKFYTDPITTPVVAIGLVGLLVIVRMNSRVMRLMVLYAIGLLVAYPVLGVAYYSWYAVPVIIAVLYGFVFMIVGIGRFVTQTINREWLRSATIIVVTTALLLPVAFTIVPRSTGFYEHAKVYSLRHQLYSRAGIWLKKNTPPDAEIGYVEVGTIAYWSQRRIRDYLALTTPGSLERVVSGDGIGAVLEHPADYLIRHNRVGLLEKFFKTEWFKSRYKKVRRFSLPGGKEFLRIYQRIDSPESPDSAPPEIAQPN